MAVKPTDKFDFTHSILLVITPRASQSVRPLTNKTPWKKTVETQFKNLLHGSDIIQAFLSKQSRWWHVDAKVFEILEIIGAIHNILIMVVKCDKSLSLCIYLPALGILIETLSSFMFSWSCQRVPCVKPLRSYHGTNFPPCQENS